MGPAYAQCNLKPIMPPKQFGLPDCLLEETVFPYRIWIMKSHWSSWLQSHYIWISSNILSKIICSNGRRIWTFMISDSNPPPHTYNTLIIVPGRYVQQCIIHQLDMFWYHYIRLPLGLHCLIVFCLEGALRCGEAFTELRSLVKIIWPFSDIVSDPTGGPLPLYLCLHFCPGSNQLDVNIL